MHKVLIIMSESWVPVFTMEEFAFIRYTCSDMNQDKGLGGWVGWGFKVEWGSPESLNTELPIQKIQSNYIQVNHHLPT